MASWFEEKAAAVKRLDAAGIAEPEADIMLLYEYICKADRTFYLMHQADEMPSDTVRRLREAVSRRCEGVPLQYITGHQEFMGFDFLVNEEVLIPRLDTEVLAGCAIDIINAGGKNMRVLDLCTGSGCLAVSLALLCPGIRMTACDISEGALKAASENAEKNKADVKFVRSDMFGAFRAGRDRFDLIVSNPPYIKSGDIEKLMREVRDHEPRMALDGGCDGLSFYKEITRRAGEFLYPGGYLAVEIGFDQARDVIELMETAGFCDIETGKDLSGLDRVVKGRLLEGKTEDRYV